MTELNIAERLKLLVGPQRVRTQEPMRHHTSFRIGGPADVLVEPGSEVELCRLITECNNLQVPFLVIGKGSNLLISDSGIRGVVLKIGRSLNRVSVCQDQVTAQAGVTLDSLARIVLQHSLAGFEFAGGIPGTLGGALAMNAGAYGGEMKDILVSCRVLSIEGEVSILPLEDMEMGYRSSRVQRTKEVILSATMRLTTGRYRQIKFLMDDYWQRRITRQPYYLPSGGSVFKRPEGYFAGKLIEDCQLKGFSIGDAMVSDLHAGFIVNKGNATAADVVKLMSLIQNRVKEKFGVELEPELRVIGV
ncbi:MAG: UDP-N-acetylmuramate dehydrogenase [Bacillota bacterium]|nr:UDP-N-acetylmuramate dehydrogenase [Bacillota bacterium]MDW7677533.1 UDP-N-acetylmuramate dehydrogenase [Bacillota bacterium]